MRRPVLIVMLTLIPAIGLPQLSTESAWNTITEEDKKSAFQFAEEYKEFLAVAKTELSTVQEIKRIAESNGFKRLTENAAWKAGAKYYDINRDRTICLIVVGKNKLMDGARLIGGHIDSPRIELKARPLYEKKGFAL